MGQQGPSLHTKSWGRGSMDPEHWEEVETTPLEAPHWTQPKPALSIARDTLGCGGWDSELPEGPQGQEGQGRPPRPHERSAKLELGPAAHAQDHPSYFGNPRYLSGVMATCSEDPHFPLSHST